MLHANLAAVIDRGRLLLLAGSTAASLLLAEGAFRGLEGRLGVDRARIRAFRDFVATGGETAHYAAWPYTLYRRRPGDPGVNSLGFYGDEPSLERRPGVPRIVCLGASTTEGYFSLLGPALERLNGRPVEVLNFAVSGWTSAEILVSYLLLVQDYRPDVVVIHTAVNDAEPRNWPGFRPDYSHYRRPWREIHYSAPFRWLVAASDLFAAWQLRRAPLPDLRGVVVRKPSGPFTFRHGHFPPGTERPFRRNLRSLIVAIRTGGGTPVLATLPYDPVRGRGLPHYREGIDEHNAILRDLARENQILLVDLAESAREHPETLQPFFVDLVHLSEPGNRLKAEAIARALTESGLLQGAFGSRR